MTSRPDYMAVDQALDRLERRAEQTARLISALVARTDDAVAKAQSAHRDAERLIDQINALLDDLIVARDLIAQERAKRGPRPPRMSRGEAAARRISATSEDLRRRGLAL